MVPVEGSSVIDSYGWEAGVGGDAGVGLLAVGLRGRGVWWYSGVPERVFEDFLMADSRGSFFARRILGRYECTKGDNDD